MKGDTGGKPFMILFSKNRFISLYRYTENFIDEKMNEINISNEKFDKSQPLKQSFIHYNGMFVLCSLYTTL